MASTIKKLQIQVAQNDDKEWRSRNSSKAWNVKSEFKEDESHYFSPYVPVDTFEESMEWQDYGHQHETIPIPKSSPKILTSSGKARMPSKKKIKKGSLLVHLSPKVCTNEASKQLDSPHNVESCLSTVKGDKELKQNLEKRSIFQGNKHGMLEGGVAIVPTVAFNNHEKAGRPLRRDQLQFHDQSYTPDLYSVSLEDPSSIDLMEDPCEVSSTVSCSYSYASNSSKEVRQERNGLNMTIRDTISSQIIQLAKKGLSQDTIGANEIFQASGGERQQKDATLNEKLKEKQRPRDYVKEHDRRSQRMVQFEKGTSSSKVENAQRRGIVKGFTKISKGKNLTSVSVEPTIDLCINAKKMEVQKHDQLQKIKNNSNSYEACAGIALKKDIHVGLVMNENAIASFSYEEGDTRDELLNTNELLLFSSRNGERASIRDNSVFQSIERRCEQQDYQDIQKSQQAKQSSELLLDKKQEDINCDTCVRETIGTDVVSPKDSMDFCEVLNNQQSIVKTTKALSTSWARRSYELGEKLLSDFHKGNVESSSFQLEWSQPNTYINNINSLKQRHMLSQSMENFRSRFGDCEPLDMEKIEIEEPPSNGCLFTDLDVLNNANESMESINQYDLNHEQKQKPNLHISVEKMEKDRKANNWELSVPEPQRPWSASCVYDDATTIMKRAQDVDHDSKLLYLDMDPPKFYENSIQYIQESRLNRLNTLRKAVLRDVSLRAEKHRMQLPEIDGRKEYTEHEVREFDSEIGTISNNMPLYSKDCKNNISIEKESDSVQALEPYKSNALHERPLALIPEVLHEENMFSNKHFNSCENFRNSDTLQVLTVVAASDFTCSTNKASNNIHETSTSSQSNINAPNGYDDLIQDLTRKYSSEDIKSSMNGCNSKFDCSDESKLQIELSNGMGKIQTNNDSPLSVVLVPSPYDMDLNKHGVKLETDTSNKLRACSSRMDVNTSFLQPQPYESHQKKVYKTLSRVSTNDRTSLSAEKLSSILSYLGQVEESNQQEGNAIMMPKICEILFGESSPRTVLDHEDALSIAASSSISTTSPTLQHSEASCVEGFQIVRHGSSLPATLPVLDGVRKKMQELKEKIGFQEARITHLEVEKLKLIEDKENITQMEKEKFGKELEARAAEYSNAIQHHLSLNEKMVKDKEMLSEKCCTLTILVNSTESRFEEKLKALNDKWLLDLSKQKELWSIGEKSKREAWMERKTKELKELTIKGLEPHLENVADKHKKEIRMMEARHVEELRKQLEHQSNEHLKNITQLRERLLGDRDDFIDKERLAAHIRMNEVAERYEKQAIHQRMHVASEFTSKLEKVEATRREEKVVAEDLINRLKKEIVERDVMFADQVGKEVEKIMQEKEQNMKDERERLTSELKSWQQSFDQLLAEELKKKEKEIQSRCHKERDAQIELVIEKLEKERQTEISQTQKNGRARIEDLLGEKRELLKKLKDQETQFNIYRKELIEDKSKIEKELVEANMQISSLQRESTWQAHLIDQLKQQAEQERITCKTREDNLLSNIQEYKLQLQKCNFEVQDMKDRKVEEYAELETRVKLAILKKDSVIEGLKHQLIVAQKQIQQTEILLQEEQRAIVAEL